MPQRNMIPVALLFCLLGQIPILLDPDITAFFDHGGMTREQVSGSHENGPWAGEVTEGKVLRERFAIKFRVHSGMSQQRFDFRCK